MRRRGCALLQVDRLLIRSGKKTTDSCCADSGTVTSEFKGDCCEGKPFRRRVRIQASHGDNEEKHGSKGQARGRGVADAAVAEAERSSDSAACLPAATRSERSEGSGSSSTARRRRGRARAALGRNLLPRFAKSTTRISPKSPVECRVSTQLDRVRERAYTRTERRTALIRLRLAFLALDGPQNGNGLCAALATARD